MRRVYIGGRVLVVIVGVTAAVVAGLVGGIEQLFAELLGYRRT